VVPLLMQGMQSLCKERPDDPVEYLASYLLQHNPKKGGAGGAGAAADKDAAQAPGQDGGGRS
jgi:protein dpy-30